MKAFVASVLTLLFCFAGMTLLLRAGGAADNASIHADTSRVFILAPSDTVTLMIPISNLSKRDVEIAGTSTSCNISDLRYPRKLRSKARYWAIATVLTPPAAGQHNDAIVFRLSGNGVFTGADVRYEVDDDAPRQDTVFLAYDKHNPRFGPSGEYLFPNEINARFLTSEDKKK